MKKRILALCFAACLMLALGATSFAAAPSTGTTLDTAAVAEAFSTAVTSTVNLILGIIPVALTLFALSFGIKKGMRIIRGM